jgi:hypothetical protein
VTRRFETREEALRDACALIDKGHEVQNLVGPDEEISQKVIEAHCRRERSP